MNQNDLLKANAVETLLKLLTMDNADIKKNALLALSQLSNHSGMSRGKFLPHHLFLC